MKKTAQRRFVGLLLGSLLGSTIFGYFTGATLRSLAHPPIVIECSQASRLDLAVDRYLQVPPGWHVTWMWATAYAPFDNQSGICADADPTTTATGTYPDWGTIAVNPKIIPYGTKMYVEGYGWGTAEDTGGAIRARVDLIDLYFDTYEEAMAWGRRKVMVILQIPK